MNIHESSENYLEIILMLKERGKQVRSIDIVNELGYSKPSVSIAMKKLRENGYVHVDTKGIITLQPAGHEIASQMYERHLTLTQLLIAAGVSKETADRDACKMEHVISEETYRCLKYFLEKR